MTDDKDKKDKGPANRRTGSAEHGSRQINEQKNLTLDHLRDKLASKPRPDNKTDKA